MLEQVKKSLEKACEECPRVMKMKEALAWADTELNNLKTGKESQLVEEIATLKAKRISEEKVFNIIRNEKWFRSSKIPTHSDITETAKAIAKGDILTKED